VGGWDGTKTKKTKKTQNPSHPQKNKKIKKIKKKDFFAFFCGCRVTDGPLSENLAETPKNSHFGGWGAPSQKHKNNYFRVTRTGGAVGGWDGGTPDHTLINTSFGTPLGGPNSGAFSRTRGPHNDTYKHKNKNKK
jgi:hypothetical protein